MDVGAVPSLLAAGVDSSKPCKPGLQVKVGLAQDANGGQATQHSAEDLCGEGVPVLASHA